MRYHTRAHAGRELARLDVDFDLVAAIPRGGVIVGAEVVKARKKPLLIVGVRKLPIPWNPEAGFGAVAEDGSVYLNEGIVRRTGITDEQIESISGEVRKEVERRVKTYRNGPIPDLSGRSVLLVDDGFATGYTAIAAINLLRKRGASRIIAAAPCAPADTVELLKNYASVLVLNIQSYLPFAVADYYEDFRELKDEEVLKAIREVTQLSSFT